MDVHPLSWPSPYDVNEQIGKHGPENGRYLGMRVSPELLIDFIG